MNIENNCGCYELSKKPHQKGYVQDRLNTIASTQWRWGKGSTHYLECPECETGYLFDQTSKRIKNKELISIQKYNPRIEDHKGLIMIMRNFWGIKPAIKINGAIKNLKIIKKASKEAQRDLGFQPSD